ncbi:MlaD family protein [Roseateles albus]|uniref:MlaD family protein n=1 Tax=Roseateles albus TaxID=2987525 RepID=A0ABT5KLS7_9BURK|nr:MlaD family protein [Roseateles albus]MDC8774469.1 MlaD family protein [Roseateles albus]
MENRAHALATGIFILFLGGVLALVAAWFQGDQGEKNDFTIVARSGVSGLNLKAPVKLRGVLVGKVESIGFDQGDSQRILIGIRVAKTAPLTQATVARLAYQGITGLSYIDLSEPDGAQGSPLLVAGAGPIELQASMLDRLSSAGPQLLERVSEAAVRVNTLLGDANQQAFSRSLSQFGEAANQVAGLSKALTPTADALPALAAQTKKLVEGAGTTLQRVDVLAAESTLLAQELRQRAELLDRIGQASAQVQQTAQRLDMALVGANRGPRSQSLVDVWSQSGRAIERTASQIGEQPQSFLFGPPLTPAGPGEVGFDESARGASK